MPELKTPTMCCGPATDGLNRDPLSVVCCLISGGHSTAATTVINGDLRSMSVFAASQAGLRGCHAKFADVAPHAVCEWRYLTGLAHTLLRVESISPHSRRLICDDLESAVDRWRDRTAFRFEGRGLTYGEMDALANQAAHWALAQGLKPGDTVAV